MIPGFDILCEGFYGAVAGIGFGAISHPPLRAFKGIALLSALGHAVRFYLMHYWGIDIATASLFGAMASGFCSLWVGQWTRCPLTVLYIPSLLPMIPGKFAYNSIFSLIMFVENTGSPEAKSHYMDLFFSNGVVTVTTVFLLAVGSAVPRFLFPKITNSVTRQKKKAKA